MEKIDIELRSILASAAADEPIRVIVQACPKQKPMDRDAWTKWANGTFLAEATKATGVEPSSFEVMPNLKTMVVTAPQVMVKQWAEAPETQSIRLQPADDQVEFYQPVKQ